MQSGRELRDLMQARRRIRELEAALVAADYVLAAAREVAWADASRAAKALATAQALLVESELAAETAHRKGYVDAANELAHRDRALRVASRQLRHLTGVLRATRDTFLDGETVDQALAELERIAASEP